MATADVIFKLAIAEAEAFKERAQEALQLFWHLNR